MRRSNRRSTEHKDISVEKHNFSRYGGSNYSVYNTRLPIVPTSVGENQSNVAHFVSYINSITDFSQDTRDEILENLYIYEPTVASAADSFGVMVRDSFKYFSHREVKKPKSLIKYLKDKFFTTDVSVLEEMISIANEISYDLNMPEIVETLATLLFVKGTVFLRKNKDRSITILPNPNVTVVDTLDRIINPGTNMLGTKSYIMEANYLIIDEGLQTQEVLNKDEFIIMKFRDVPLFVEDGKHRNTYGIYSISPLRRALIPIWYKRIAMANDALWRAKSVPREHHQLDAESFSTDHFTGRNKQAAQAAAQAAAASALSAYKESFVSQAPDQAYFTLSSTKIGVVEPHSTSYMNSNDLIEQMNQETYSAINMPQSVVRGVSSSNYASELIISSYTTTKVKQVANKVMRVMLEVMRERLLDINPNYPVKQLDVKISYVLANSKLENAKIAQVFASMGICYVNELREMNDMDPLEDKFNVLVDTSNKISPASPETPEETDDKERAHADKMAKEAAEADVKARAADAKERAKAAINSGGQAMSSDGKVNYPTTSHSAEKQSSDSQDALYNKATSKK